MMGRITRLAQGIYLAGFCLLLGLIISGCSSKNLNIPIVGTPSLPATLTSFPSPFPTYTNTPFPTPLPTLTPLPIIITAQDTPNPPKQILSWGQWLGEPIVLEDFYGIWSPTSDELVGIKFTSRITGTLSLSSATEFQLQPIPMKQTGNALFNPTWSPDGQTILFGVPYRFLGRNPLPLDIYSRLFAIDRTGTNLRQLPGNYRSIDFPKWIDSNTLVVTYYSGGGYASISEINYLTGKILVDDTLNYFFLGPPQDQYLPINSGVDHQVHILSRDLQFQPGCQDFCLTRQFPNQIVDEPDYFDTSFEDWLPGKTVAVINAMRWMELGTRLFLWDLDTDNVSTLIPGGISAHFSPDGQILLFTTFGPYSLYSSNIKDRLILDPVSDPDTIYLQLMNYPDNEVLMSIPAITWEEFINTPRGYFNIAWFSPDGRYLAFQSLGQVTLDENDWPVSVVSPSNGKVFLNILDLQLNKLIYTISDFANWYELTWSPMSNQLVYRNIVDEWNIFDLSKMELLPITIDGGPMIFEIPTWSYDGHYLSVTTMPPLYEQNSSIIYTYIFDLFQKK